MLGGEGGGVPIIKEGPTLAPASSSMPAMFGIRCRSTALCL